MLDAIHARSGCDRDALDLVGIRVVGDSKEHVETHVLVGERPVDDFGGDEVLVRNEKFATVAGDHGDEAGAQFPDPAESFPECDGIARFDGLVHENDDAGDEVGNDLLQAESDTHADGTGE